MTTPSSEALVARIAALRQRAETDLSAKIIAIMSGKGGVGKTLLAMEISYLINGVLVDFDWDGGNATRAMGHLHERYARVPLLDALTSGKTPTPRRMGNRPDLVPGHPEFATAHPSAEALTEALVRWAKDWQRPVVVDTHPGGGDPTFGAVGAADSVVSPVELATRELNALEEQLKELAGYPLLLIPNEVPTVPPAAEIDRLADLSTRFSAPVGPMVNEYTWYRRRKLRTVVTSADEFSARALPFVADLVTVAEAVVDHAAA